MSADRIIAYTDGSASYKVGNGGWACVITDAAGNYGELYGFADNATISDMELEPIKRVLEFLPTGTRPVRILSDSTFAVNSLNVWYPEWEANGFITSNAKPPKQLQLIMSIMELLDKQRETRSVSISWIAGHRKHPHNERADFLAGYARVNKATNWPL
jgi:ribonuclease HI